MTFSLSSRLILLPYPLSIPATFRPSFFRNSGLLVVIITLFVTHNIEESELVYARGGADHAEPVTELLLFEVFLGSVIVMLEEFSLGREGGWLKSRCGNRLWGENFGDSDWSNNIKERDEKRISNRKERLTGISNTAPKIPYAPQPQSCPPTQPD